ncbi:MAG: hypothetical protein ACRD2H_02270 [Terriglobales bacterium]
MINPDVVALTKTGLAPEVIEAKIHGSACAFDTSVTALDQLKSAGVAQPVIAAMVGAKCEPAPSATTADPPSAEPSRPRVYVTAEATKSSRWRVFGGSDAVAGGGQGGVDPQRDEVIKTLLKNCPGVAVTMNADKADFHLDMQREPNKGYLRKRDKWVLTAHNGDVVGAGLVRSVGNVVKDACTLMTTPH